MPSFRTPFARNLFAAAFGAAALASMAPASAATINVTCAGGNPAACTNNLNSIFDGANATDVVSIGPGTYTAMPTGAIPTADYFYIRKNIRVVSTAGPGTTILKGGTANTAYVVRFTNLGGDVVNGASIEGFALQNGWGGVEILDFGGGDATIDNITLKNLVFTPINLTGTNTSHGISFSKVTNSRIESVTVNGAYNNGIYIFKGSGNLVIDSTVNATSIQHAIALSNTSGAIVSGNTVNGSGFHGIIALGLKNSRIERNTITGQQHDGITITRDLAPPATFDGISESNFIGHNTVNSTVWSNDVHPDGTGIFLNGNSNGNYVFGNRLQGSPENGMALFGPSFNYVHANRIHRNFQGGILIWNEPGLGQPAGGSRPTNTLVRNNFIYYNPTNAMVNLRDTEGTDIAFNYLAGANFAGDPVYPATAPGAGGGAFSANPGGLGAALYPTDNNIRFYGNSVIGMVNAIYLDTDTTNSSLFRNRFFGLGGSSVMDFYSNSPATVAWDGGAAMGGNFWQGHAATGNPSNGGSAFTDIYCPGPVGCSYQDTFPFAAESFGETASVTVSLPRTGAPVAAGSTKTIAWSSRACSLVDLHLMNGGAVQTTIATNYPDVGYFVWNVAPGEASGSRTVRVTCKNNAGSSLGVTGSSGAFNIHAQGLTLLSPGPFTKVTGNTSTLVVSWKRGAGITGGVSVHMSVDGAAETNPATNVLGNHVTIAVPNVNSNRVAIRIVTGSSQDSSDGHFSIANTTNLGFTGVTAGSNVPFGSRMKLEWKTHPSSRYVNLEVFNGATYQAVATNVPDFGNYEWLVPAALVGNNRNFRITYKSTSGQAAPGLGQSTSNNFNITAITNVDLSVSQATSPSPGNVGKDVISTITVSNAGPATATSVVVTDTLPAGVTAIWTSLECSTAGGTVTCPVASLASGASAQFKVVWRPTSTGTKTNTVTVASAQSDTVPGNNTSAVGTTINSTPAGIAVQRYRLYSPVTLEHHFTTDLNEYNVLGTFVGTWIQEGTVGKVLNNPGAFGGVTAVPYYRLYDTQTQWHHWTTDANEYYTLGLFPWWNQEGVDGYILPTQGVGSVPLYRLLYPFVAGLHHWTIDADEYNALTTSFGWIGEGGSGFVIP